MTESRRNATHFVYQIRGDASGIPYASVDVFERRYIRMSMRNARHVVNEASGTPSIHPRMRSSR